MSLPLEVVTREGEVCQAWQLANTLRHKSCQLVVVEIKEFNLLQACKAGRQDSGEPIVAGIKDSHITKQPNFCREAPTEAIAHKDDLVQVGHPADAVWNAASELVVSECDDRNGGVAYCLRDGGCEPVVIQEQSIELLVEEFWRQTTFEIIESEVKILEAWPGQNNRREITNKAVVADIKLIHECEPGKALRNDTTKPVRVNVE